MMAIKPAPVMAHFGFDYGRKPHFIQFTQHFSTRWKPGEVLPSESVAYRLRFDNKEQLLARLKDPARLIQEVLDELAPRVAEKHFEGLVAETFTIGFSETEGFTVDAFDKRHLKLLEKHPSSGLLPPAQDQTPSP